MERVQHVGCVVRDDDLTPGIEEVIESLEPVADDGHSASCCLEQPPGRTIPEARHRAPRDIQREAGGRKKSGVLAGRDMLDMMDVARCSQTSRIHRATQDELLARPRSGRREEQLFQPFLAVSRVGAEIGERRAIGARPIGGPMKRRIDMAIERRNPTCAKPLVEQLERATASEAQHQIEARQPVQR
jgi:hypothetical protein